MGGLGLDGSLDQPAITPCASAARWGSRRSTTKPAGQLGWTPETVGGFPARVWEYGWAGPASKWRGLDFAAFAADQFRYGRLSRGRGPALRRVAWLGRGRGARDPWTRLLTRGCWPGSFPSRTTRSRCWPATRGTATDCPSTCSPTATRTRPTVARTAGTTPTPTASSRRASEGRWWRGSARAGPSRPSILASGLRSPGKSSSGFETSAGSWKVRMLGYYRRERDLVTSVNFGAPLSAYDVYYIEDPSDDITGVEDDHLLPVYNRRPESFGQDQYLLTNDPEKGTRQGAGDRDRRADREAPAAADRSHRLEDLQPVRLSRVPGHRERPGPRRRAAGASERRHLLEGAPLLRARVHGQDRGRLPGALGPSPGRGRPLPGRPALRALRDPDRPQPGARAHQGHLQRRLALLLRAHDRRAHREGLRGGPRAAWPPSSRPSTCAAPASRSRRT